MQVGELEEKIMLAILLRGNDTYGAQVRETLAQAGRKVSIGALYTTLDRLESKGLIEGRESEVPSPHGGKARRYFQVTGVGKEALNRNREVVTKLTTAPLGGAA